MKDRRQRDKFLCLIKPFGAASSSFRAHPESSISSSSGQDPGLQNCHRQGHKKPARGLPVFLAARSGFAPVLESAGIVLYLRCSRKRKIYFCIPLFICRQCHLSGGQPGVQFGWPFPGHGPPGDIEQKAFSQTVIAGNQVQPFCQPNSSSIFGAGPTLVILRCLIIMRSSSCPCSTCFCGNPQNHYNDIICLPELAVAEG